MHLKLLVVFIPDLLKLLLFLAVLIDLVLELALEFLNRGLECLNIRLLKVKRL